MIDILDPHVLDSTLTLVSILVTTIDIVVKILESRLVRGRARTRDGAGENRD